MTRDLGHLLGQTGALGQAQHRLASRDLIRNSFHYAGRHDWETISKDLRPVYQPINADGWHRVRMRLTESTAAPSPCRCLLLVGAILDL